MTDNFSQPNNSIVLWLAIINTIAIVVIPVFAVWVCQYLQDRKKKYNAKLNLLLILISHRANQVHPDFVMALNQIDLVYYDNQKVIDAWHRHFDNFYKKDEVDFDKRLQRSFLDLVSVMSKNLGYTDLKQTDFDNVYTPVAHQNQATFDQELKENLAGFLQGGNMFFELLKIELEKKKMNESMQKADEN